MQSLLVPAGEWLSKRSGPDFFFWTGFAGIRRFPSRKSHRSCSLDTARPPSLHTRRARGRDAWFGAVAQLGERLVRNEEVSGSIPLSSTSLRCCAAPVGWPGPQISRPIVFYFPT